LYWKFPPLTSGISPKMNKNSEIIRLKNDF
jgi:hypothetical protein